MKRISASGNSATCGSTAVSLVIAAVLLNACAPNIRQGQSFLSGIFSSITQAPSNTNLSLIDHLAFKTEPANSVSNAALSPSVVIEVLTQSGIVDTSSSASITLSIGNNPAGGILSGALSVNAVSGIATFSGLSIDQVGVGYTLVANAGSFLVATSSSFNVLATADTWVSGTEITNQGGTYGTIGVGSTTNIPGSRFASSTWTDASGNFWLFGGDGYDISGNAGALNDLWQYSPVTKKWTWVSGSNLQNQVGVYGSQGVGSVSNIPGAREGAASWMDSEGDFWLFGGSNGPSFYNDLWEFNPSSLKWTWMGGSTGYNQAAVYGTEGVGSTSNVPSARGRSVSWTDSAGDFWLFGGANGYGYLNDLWQYSPSTQKWTWVSGNSGYNVSGSYGSQGLGSVMNIPGSRAYAVSWTDSAGNFWIFGGQGYDNFGGFGDLNDFWQYSPATQQWTWVDGANAIGQSGTYGIQGIASNTTIPGARTNAVSWSDPLGNFWLFGGFNGGGGLFNDLWKYNGASQKWTWVSGSNLVNQGGTYGTEGTANTANFPGSRENACSWTDAAGNLWLFGGAINGASLNDLWMLVP